MKIRLTGTIFRGANLRRANLRGANFRGAYFRKADLRETYLGETDLSYANLRGCKNLTVEQLSKAKTLYKAQLDPEIKKKLLKSHKHLFEKPDYMK